MKAGVAALASSWLLTLALTALGAPSFSRVALLLPACEAPGLGANELREAVALDARDAGLSLAPPGELSAASDVLVQVAMDCSAESQFTLNAQFADERRTRRVDLSELPRPQRARALSLAIAELLALFDQPSPPASTSEFAAPADAAVAAAAPVVAPPRPKTAPPAATSARKPPAPPAALEDHPRARQPTASWWLSVAPELRFFDTTWLYGGRALAHYGAWSAGLDVLRAQESAPTGSVTTLLLHGSVAYSFVLHSGLERAQLEVGPRLGLGRTFMTAQPTDNALGSDAADVYFDAALAGRYSLLLTPLLRLGLAAELGYARGPIGYADDRALASTAGSFASVLIDASFHP